MGLLPFPRATSAPWLGVQEPSVSTPTAPSPASRSGAVLRRSLAFFKVRWLRLLALPGVWLALAIDLASLRGVHVPVHSVIHVLGNLRRLRSS